MATRKRKIVNRLELPQDSVAAGDGASSNRRRRVQVADGITASSRRPAARKTVQRRREPVDLVNILSVSSPRRNTRGAASRQRKSTAPPKRTTTRRVTQLQTGYKDEPYLDPRGEPRWRRITPIHHAARRKYYDVVRQLFKIYDRFEVNYTHPSSGLTHFHVACMSGCVDIVERFIESGHNANCLVQQTGDSLLHLALRNKQKEVIELLLKRGGDPNLANAKGETPLHITDREYYDAGCVNTLFEICDEIERSVKVDARDELGYSPLLLAVHSGNAQFVELLLNRGADPNAADKNGSTPLHFIGEGDIDDDVAEIFLRTNNRVRHLQLDPRNQFGCTPLHVALNHGRKSIVESLLRRGVDPNLADAQGLTPLHIICQRDVGDELAEIFLRVTDEVERRVQLDARNQFGNAPLHSALFRGKMNMVESLLKRGADLNLANPKGSTALHIVSNRESNDDSAETLLRMIDDFQLTVPADVLNQWGRTPLHLAASYRHVKFVKSLLSRGADPNLADTEGWTPLHIICKSHVDDDRAEIFLQTVEEVGQRVQLDARNQFGSTPLHFALRRGKRNTVKSLLKRGANLNLANSMGSTCLHIISGKDLDDDSAETYLRMIDDFQLAVQVDVPNKSGYTPLNLSLYWCKKKTAEALLRRGADPNLPYKDVYTPLHIICERYTDDDVAETFLRIVDDTQSTVQLDAPDQWGRTPLHVALYFGNKRAAEALLRRGADPNIADKKGSTVLHRIASRKTDDDLVQKFFEICGDIRRTVQFDAANKFGRTPLHLALRNGHKRLTEWLLRNDANPYWTDLEKSTALHMICKRDEDDADLLKLFFKICDEKNKTVKVDAIDKFGLTPLQWAVANLLPNTVDFLLDNGADLSSFVFPTEHKFRKRFKQKDGKWDKLRLASGALGVVERLENRGYGLNRSDSLKIVKLFAEYGLLEKSEEPEIRSWCDDEEFASRAKEITIVPGLSLYDLLRLRPEEEDKLLTYRDYFEIERSNNLDRIPERYRDTCSTHLCEKMSRGYFRRLGLDSLLDLMPLLPILCCVEIIEKLKNEDLKLVKNCVCSASKCIQIKNKKNLVRSGAPSRQNVVRHILRSQYNPKITKFLEKVFTGARSVTWCTRSTECVSVFRPT
ncbi:unnamed protein product [Trichogramma brassicae]|uniref:Uncharacterized protein n=1 Tax=Trichogramma brassicae TaxID=86971 RepID=A0A6H5I7N3_9HYME|nr:unnamed protein product [Trichogramma brassicae]